MKKLILSAFYLLLLSCNNIEVKELEYPEDLKVITRKEWGWIPLEKSKEQFEISKITIHHGGVLFSKDKDALTSIKNLQKWSRNTKHWIDLPYHFVIDLKGNIYEGRPINYSGDTNTKYNPTGHALVEVMGNYEIQELSKTQKQALISLIAYLKKEFNVPLNEIKTHLDYTSETVCPGKNIYKYFKDGSLLKEVDNYNK